MANIHAEPFTISVSEAALTDLKDRLSQVRWPDQPDGIGWEQGTDLAYLKSLVNYWRSDFDWRAQEAALNKFSQFRATIGNQQTLKFGVAAYAIVRDSERETYHELKRITDVRQSAAGYANFQQWLAGSQLEQQVSLEDYSVSNRGLRSGLVGSPDRVAERIAEFEDAGVDLLLL